MKKRGNKLFVVIPCYNEEEVLHETTKRLKEKLETLINNKVISKDSKVMYVNDGSKDKTWDLIKEISAKEELFTGITLSRNRGHQNALVAGLLTAKKYADVVISMDADLQDDINAIDEMLEKYNEGCDIVYGVRSARKTDTFFKRFTAESFYKVMNKMGVETIYNHADYRLTSKRVLDEFSNYKEVNLFLRGIFPLIGFKSDKVYYERAERFAGKSKYPLKKMIDLAWDGITSFSTKPIDFVMFSGIGLCIVNVIVLIILFIIWLVNRSISVICFSFFLLALLGSINLFATGLVGEYIGKTYIESKHRPRFIVGESLLENDKDE